MHFDVESRRNKARKIITLIDGERALLGCRVLEIGTGTGVISAELARATGPGGAVVSIDTMDTRVDEEGYEFQVTAGVTLPFPDAAFDVVVSNHVVEHVGGRADQQVHLEELRRVLQPEGIGYLATPTRWALIEPHFKVPLLSWPPRGMRDRYVRLTGRGTVYDVDPFGPREIRAAFDKAGLRWVDKTLAALDELVRVEKPTAAAKVLAAAPEWVRRAVKPLLGTMIYVVRHKD
jgi:ubiquinone/menaquinone biosynthesis C-methylase UbiE